MERVRPTGQGLMLKLYCSHQSVNLMKMTISRPNRRQSGHSAMKQVLEQMQLQRRAKDPAIVGIDTAFNITTKRGNNLDEATTNDYIFESVKAQTAIEEIVEREGNPTEGGGSFEFYFFRFVSNYDHGTGLGIDEVVPSVFQQGFMENQSSAFTNIPQFTLTKPDLASGNRANTLALDSDLQTERGTNLIAIGDQQSGTYPIDYSRVLGAKDVFQTALLWTAGRTYKFGQLTTFVQSAGSNISTQFCLQDNIAVLGVNDPNTGSGTFWKTASFIILPDWVVTTTYTKADFVKDSEIAYVALITHVASALNRPPNAEHWARLHWSPTTDYSPLTQGTKGAQYWLNNMPGAKHASTDNVKTSVVDPSVIVKDEFHPRTWVDCVENDPDNISAAILRPGSQYTNGDVFNGFRALVMTPGTGVSAGFGDWSAADKNGVDFAGSVVEWQEDPIETSPVGQWVVISNSHPEDPPAVQDQEVFDFEEGDSWVKEPCTSGTVNESGVCSGSRDANWLKGRYAITGVIQAWQAGKQFTCVHALPFDSGAGNVDMGNERLLNNNPDVGVPLPNVTTSGVFIKFTPSVSATAKGLSASAWDFAGANFAFPWPRTRHTSPFATVAIGEKINLTQFDLSNMFQTQDGGNPDWLGPQVEDYYPIQGFAMMNKIVQTYGGEWLGNSIYSPTGDYKMALWIADREDNIWIMDYSINYNDDNLPAEASLGVRRIFRAVPGVATFIPAREPEVLDIFDFRQVVRGGFYTKESFDDQGRYQPLVNRYFLSSQVKLSFDAWRMIKPLVCTNLDEPGGEPERNIEPQKLQYEKIGSYAQLKNYVLAVQQVYNFRTDAFPIRTFGRCNIAFGDPVFYNDTEAIDNTFDPTGLNLANTIRATAHKITYTVSKGVDGPGGFLRDVELITRLYPE